MDGAPAPDEDFNSLSISERLSHKNWKARKSGYEATIKAIDRALDTDDGTVQLFLRDPGLMKAVVSDSNVIAQQDAYGVLCTFLKFTQDVGCQRLRSTIVPICAEKGLSATRPITKQKALEALLLFAEMDHPNPVVEEMLPFLSQKVPKNIAAVLSALREMCREFGCRVVNPRPVVKALPKAFAHADKNVRAEAQSLAAEVYRWVGEGMKIEFWGELKPVQQQELEKLFEQTKNEPPPQAQRLILSQQLKQQQAEEAGGADGAGGAEEEEEEIVFLPDAVDVLPLITPNIYANLASSSWKERREGLDDLLVILNKPRIADGPFDDLVRALAKTPKDINVVVATVGANCIQALASGLGPAFAKHRSTVLGPLLDRLKEKKQTILDALGGALDAVFASSGIADCLEEILEPLQHKVPGVRAETAKFLVRCLKTTKEAPSLAETKTIADAAIKLLGDSQEPPRNAAAEILGTLWKIMGDRVMCAHLEAVDELRKAKIKDYHDAAEVRAKFKPKAPKPVAPPPTAATKRPGPTATKKVAPAKKPPPAAAPAPVSAYASTAPSVPQLDATPVAPRIARPGLVKPGVKPGLPLQGTLKKPSFGPPKSAAGPAPVLTSPRRPEPEETAAPTAVPGPRLGGLRGGLASRPLSRPAPVSAADAFSEPSAPVIAPLTSAEKAELEELRAESDRLRRLNDELRSERARWMAEVAELRSLNKELNDTHTCEIKAKDMQLRRARTDQAAAEQAAESSAREIERLKRELSRAVRSASPAVPEYKEPVRRGNGLSGQGTSSSYNADYPHEQMSGRYSAEGKENYPRTSAPTSGYSAPRSHSTHSSSTGIPPISSSTNPVYEHSPPTPTQKSMSQYQQQPPSQHQRYFSPSRPNVGPSVRASDPSQIPPMSNGVESWKRAAEVTQNLKARIELMKARQGARRP